MWSARYRSRSNNNQRVQIWMIHPASEEFGSAAELQIRFHECGVAVYSILPPDLIFYMDNQFRDELAMIIPVKPMLLSQWG